MNEIVPIINHDTMNIYGGVETYLHAFLTSQETSG